MKIQREGQLYCGICEKPVGLSDQTAAYASALFDGWLCPRHNDIEEQNLKQEQRERDADLVA